MLFLYNPGLSDDEKQQRFTELEADMAKGPITNEHSHRMLSLVRELPPETATEVFSSILLTGCRTAEVHLEEDPLPEVPSMVVDFFRMALTFCFEGATAEKATGVSSSSTRSVSPSA